MSAIIGDGVEFVELVLAEAFGTEAGDTKTKARNRQDNECGEDECPAVCQHTTSGEELRPQTGSDDGFSVCRQDSNLSTKRERVSEELGAVKNSLDRNKDKLQREQVRKRGLPPPLLGFDQRGQAPLLYRPETS